MLASKPLLPKAEAGFGVSDELLDSFATVFPNALGCELRLENAPKPGAGLELPNPLEPKADEGFGASDVVGDSFELVFPKALGCEFRFANAPKPEAGCELPNPLEPKALLVCLEPLPDCAA